MFLDVDGVLSPLPHESEHWGDWEVVKCGFHCYLSRLMAVELRSLPVTIEWLTSWRELANEVIAPHFEWEELVVHDDRDLVASEHEDEWWKFNLISEFLRTQPDASFVWIDDDLTDEYIEKTHQLILDLGNHARALCIRPNSSVGITPVHIRAIREFVS